MIGIICSKKNEKEFAEKLHNLYINLKRMNDDLIIVFTISNIDFVKKTVTGNVISRETITTVQVPLPPVIFNFSIQKNVASIKARRTIEDMDNIELINGVNKFNQYMIMDILSSSADTSNYLLPYYIYDRNNRNFMPDEHKSYIEMPLKGTSITKMACRKQYFAPDDVNDIQYLEKERIGRIISSSLYERKRIFIEIPELNMHNAQPIIVRTYLQRSSENEWMIIGNNIYPKIEIKDTSILEKTRITSLTAIKYIKSYLPNLGQCYIDLIVSSDGNPYFLHFGGINEDLFTLEQNQDFYKKFYENLIKLARYINVKKKVE